MIISFCNAKGGAGKTTSVMHLAHVYAGRGMSVCVVDADPQASASCWHGDAAAIGEPLPFPVEFLASAELLRRRLQLIDAAHQVVLIDPPPGNRDIMKEAIRASDLVVIPLNARPDDMRQAMTTAAQCAGLADPVPCAALLNRVKSNELSSMQVARTSLIGAGVPVLTTVIPDWAEIGQAFGSVVGEQFGAERTRRSYSVWLQYQALAAELDHAMVSGVTV